MNSCNNKDLTNHTFTSYKYFFFIYQGIDSINLEIKTH